ncbi:cell division protein DrpB [Atlantibacter hermannii]|uniref:cell division protein DrpB n=1 Tax=Atlantibacter hermannii TaxID=565 RepID=UPI0028AF8D3C|nr:cell division protein DrpB [Atlantibacter hermannii]
MEERNQRSPGGKLALWAFYAYCGYFLWVMARYLWIVSGIEAPLGATSDWSMATASGKWLGALLGATVMSAIGAVLGAVAWYTRPRRD